MFSGRVSGAAAGRVSWLLDRVGAPQYGALGAGAAVVLAPVVAARHVQLSGVPPPDPRSVGAPASRIRGAPMVAVSLFSLRVLGRMARPSLLGLCLSDLLCGHADGPRHEGWSLLAALWKRSWPVPGW